MSLAAFRTDLQFSRVKAFIFCLHLEKKSIQYMFHHIVPNEGPNGSYNGFCINLVVNSVKDGNEKSVGLDVDLLMSLAFVLNILMLTITCMIIAKIPMIE